MKKLSKISVRYIMIALGAIAIVTVLVFSVQTRYNSDIEDVKISLVSENSIKLISKNDVYSLLKRTEGAAFKSKNLKDIDIKNFEQRLDKSKFIKNAEVYVDLNGILNIYCVLNDPIIRVKGQNQKDFYFDKDGNIIPLSENATCRVPLLTGNIEKVNFQQLKKIDTEANKILKLGIQINKDQFLSALVEQIYVENNGKLILIPKVGNQKIEFGNVNNLDEKLEKIRIFYRTGMAGSGWRKFTKINIEWEGQIVGSS
jgi:cell division protein FtsQ